MSEGASIVLSELQLDALTELVNLGVSTAAFSLREMMREEVKLSVPSVQLVTRKEALAKLGEREVKSRLVAVQQYFEGDITGRALLIFPEAKSFELVRAVVGRDMSLADIFELEQEAMAETGNILLNACLSTMANHLGRSLKISLPEVMYGEGQEFFDATPPFKNDRVLFVYINFAVQLRDIRGYIAMLLDMPSLVNLKQLIDDFIERTAGRGGASSPS